MTNTILIVDDEPVLADAMGDYLGRHGYTVRVKRSGEEALASFDKEPPDIVVLDYRLPRMDGLEVLRRIKKTHPEIEVILLTAHGSVQGAVEAMKMGAFDYLSKPLDLEELRLVVGRALQSVRQTQELTYLRAKIEKENPTRQIVGESEKILDVKRLIEQIAAIETSSGREAPAILITGETGTGKELVARSIHGRSARAKGPFIEINCAAIPGNLVESELFGYERGAFTDAKAAKLGLFEAADTGTLFLDELGSLDLSLQAKLLKALEEKSVRRLGGVQSRRFDVMLIAATNQPLEKAIQQRTFRQDLYYRLKVLEVNLPPVRDRRNDSLLLAEHFLNLHSRRYNRGGKELSVAAREMIAGYTWPGNVRELSNVMERAVLLISAPTVDAADLVLTPHRPTEFPAMAQTADNVFTVDLSKGIVLDDVERTIIENVLTRAGWNRTRAAHMLGLSRETLRYRIEKHNLKPLISVADW